jgi:hypothetical protein
LHLLSPLVQHLLLLLLLAQLLVPAHPACPHPLAVLHQLVVLPAAAAAAAAVLMMAAVPALFAVAQKHVVS